MNLVRYLFASDWNQGTYTNGSTRLDATVNLDAYNHPAIIPNQNITSTASMSGEQALAGTNETTLLVTDLGLLASPQGAVKWYSKDQFAITTQAGDTIQWTTNAIEIDIQLTGYLASGQNIPAGSSLDANEIRNGCLVNVLVDGLFVEAIDTYQQNPLATVFLDGNTHTISFQHSGGYSTSFNPVGHVTAFNTVGTTNTVVSTLQVTPQYHSTFIAASWRVLATSSTQYSIYQTLPGQSETLIIAGLTSGNSYGIYVNGCNIFVQTNVTLVSGDSATFTTDVTTCAVQTVTMKFGNTVGAGVYTGPVIDSGATDTSWVLSEWEQDTPLTSFVFQTGNTPIPDATWQTLTISPPADFTLPGAGTEMGMAGLLSISRGRYAQWQVNFAAVSAKQPYIRNLYLYYWVPERNSTLVTKLGLARNWTPGPIFHALLASFGVTLARRRQETLDFVASYAISGAIDQYLYSYAQDFGITPFTAEPPQALRQRLLASLQSKAQGGSSVFIAQQLALLVTGSLASGAVQSGVSGSVTVTCNGVVVAQSGASNQQYSITIPSAPYAGLPGLDTATAHNIITGFIIGTLNPAGSRINPGAGYNIFFN